MPGLLFFIVTVLFTFYIAPKEKAVYDAKQKEYEDKICPVMVKMYQKAGTPGADASTDQVD